ncbi:Response regulator receiver protein [Acidobacteriia bacterium SbA2]|nr:Response regulator receiver protein [Acidobacteriia bacterium SbA2]
MTEEILLVDDEPAVLMGYERLLRRELQVTTVIGGAAGLVLLKYQGPFAVVVSDMRMPEMNGIEFLLKVQRDFPDTVRVMLTGDSDLQTAIDAVNQGKIFRFLSKPCNKETLVKTLRDSLEQHRLVCAEKEILENTLRGTIYVLTEVLSLVSPAAFSRAARVRRYVQHVASKLSLENPWRLEIAAMMSQLGCVTLDPDIIEAVHAGRDLSPQEQAQYIDHPLMAQELLKSIPRLESIAWMIAHQNRQLPVDWDVGDSEMREMRLGAQILRASLAFDLYLRKHRSSVEAALSLKRRFEDLDLRIVDALVELEPEVAGGGASSMPITELTAGLILDEEVRTGTGVLVAAKGQEITAPLLLKLKTFAAKQHIPNEVVVCAAKQQSPAPPAASDQVVS